jgi:hypothetical protein
MRVLAGSRQGSTRRPALCRSRICLRRSNAPRPAHGPSTTSPLAPQAVATRGRLRQLHARMLSHLAGPVLACRELCSASPVGRRGSLRLGSPGGGKRGAVRSPATPIVTVDWRECRSEVIQDRARLCLCNPPCRRSIQRSGSLSPERACDQRFGGTSARAAQAVVAPAVGAEHGQHDRDGRRPRFGSSRACRLPGRLALSRGPPASRPGRTGRARSDALDQPVFSGRAGLHATLSRCRDSVGRARCPDVTRPARRPSRCRCRH